MKAAAGLVGGLAGTLTVASIHETLKKISSEAPRMDILDMELIEKGFKSMNKEAPGEDVLRRWAIGGELFCDTAYYALAGVGGKKSLWLRGSLLGLFAGVTAVLLPKPLGLSYEASNKTMGTRLMTIGLYLMGGLAAAAAAQLVEEAQSQSNLRRRGVVSRKAT